MMLTVVGKRISVSAGTVYPASSLVDTVTNFGGFIDSYTKKQVDTVLIVKIIDPVKRAAYKISEVIKGEFEKDTVNFIYRDRNHVSSSKDVLLFLDKTGNSNYVLKQPPVEVYGTKDNRWASPYIVEMDKYSRINFRKVKFKPVPVFDVGGYGDEYVKKHYPSPHYRIKKGKAFAVQGIYAEELSTLFNEL
jgi:hypothetical protein